MRPPPKRRSAPAKALESRLFRHRVIDAHKKRRTARDRATKEQLKEHQR